MRRRDTLARLGDDEFGALIEHCAMAKAEEIAWKLCRKVKGYSYAWKGQEFSVGASIGIVPINTTSGRAADVLRAADTACYVTKEAGGNQVHVERLDRPSGPVRDVESRRIRCIPRSSVQ